LLGVHHALPLVAADKLKCVLTRFIARQSDICIYYPARKHLPPRVTAFVEFVVGEVRESEIVTRSKALVRRKEHAATGTASLRPATRA
jgi:hypothetical protein